MGRHADETSLPWTFDIDDVSRHSKKRQRNGRAVDRKKVGRKWPRFRARARLLSKPPQAAETTDEEAFREIFEREFDIAAAKNKEIKDRAIRIADGYATDGDKVWLREKVNDETVMAWVIVSWLPAMRKTGRSPKKWRMPSPGKPKTARSSSTC